ncbi:hypothetical protein QR680_016490 [Steinernema hermaphroditum]|uniref:Uncharacterized protein n=1 Tax=Steinernema hermaphroditum TaxID=289476 RepID=A0AA39HCH9_9BILA|nr:hypothetical protein QR680_016490 [Steinernema hermaphroditum]
MDYLPHAFYDNIFGQLKKEDIEPAQDLPGAFGRVARDHYGKRRELRLSVTPNMKTKLCSIELSSVELFRSTPVPFSNLSTKYDRITDIRLSEFSQGESVSFNEALSKISLFLHIASNCSFFTSWKIHNSAVFMKPFFKLLGRSQTFKEVYTPNYGEECEEFMRKQMKSAHLEELSLPYEPWPSDFQGLVASWTENPKFRRLHWYSTMPDYETIASLLKRWVNGELKRFSVETNVSFEKHRILTFLKDLGCSTVEQTFQGTYGTGPEYNSVHKLPGKRSLKLSFRSDHCSLRT